MNARLAALRSVVVLLAVLAMSGIGKRFVRADSPTRFYSARCAYVGSSTWGICNRDGANRSTAPYLSSLVGGESGTGRMSSPPFKLSVDTIRFTIRGHDGPHGGEGKNYVALIDNKTGRVLRRTPAPGNDALQQREWKVVHLKGRKVRIEMVDGNSAGAFAWLGVGRIDAGPEMTVDFRTGLPATWQAGARPSARHQRPATVLTSGPVPFRVYQDTYTWIPPSGRNTVRIGTKVKRLYFLGATVAGARVLRTYGLIDIVYADQSKESYPLVYGFTLGGQYKTPSHYDALYVLPIGDQTQRLLVIRPRSDLAVDRIELRRASDALARPRISAVTCEIAHPSAAPPEQLDPLPQVTPSPGDAQWIAQHTLTANGPTWKDFADTIRRSRNIPVTLAEIQRLEQPARLHFERRKISSRSFEAASVCDVDRDGHKDIVSGNYWYAGPQFTTAHKFRSIQPAGGYYDLFDDYPLDVNGDGYADIISGGWTGQTLRWRENPGRDGGEKLWPVHEIDRPGPIETTRFWDVDGDGWVDVVPNAGGNVVFYRLLRDARGKGTGRFEKHVVKQGGCGHGLGFGDINGDGRGDFVIPTGWLEAPADPLTGKWRFHPEFQLQLASVPILVYDVNHDQHADIIYGSAHGYGLFWLAQKVGADGKRTWTRYVIDDQSSQYHTMELVDLDNDGHPELVAGKRYHAHNGHDPGAEDPLFVRYFTIDRYGLFAPHTIDYGPAGKASGVGIYFWVADVTGNGRLDIIAPGKEGLYLFLNQIQKTPNR